MAHHVSRRLALMLATLTLVMGIPLGIVLAGHDFNDVSNSNPFHNDISAIYDAGVTTGCGGNNYCPKDAVTREQMAAFMNRLGALAAGKPPVVNADRVDGLDSTEFGLAGVRSASDGAVVQWFNRLGGEPTISHPQAGRYNVTIPGGSFHVNANFIGVANVIGSSGGFAAIGSVSGAVTVYTFDASGNPADRAFMLLIHDASSSG